MSHVHPCQPARRLGAVLLCAVALLLTGCGDDDDAADLRTSPPDELADSTTDDADGGGDRDMADQVGADDAAGAVDPAGEDGIEGAGDPDSNEGPTEADDPAGEPSTGAVPGACDLAGADDVAAVVGTEVVEVRTIPGTGSFQDIDYTTDTCRFALPDGEVDVRILFDPSGIPFDADDVAELRAASQASRLANDHPHEEVSGIGQDAYFKADPLGNKLVIDRGDLVVTVDGDLADEPLPRDVVRELGLLVATP